MAHQVEILDISEVTHDVRCLTVQKPEGYEYAPGQATEVAIDRDGWREEGRPFTFTSLASAPTLEFVIKIYPDHDGVTEQIGKLKVGDRLLIGDPWGAIRYKGPGCFIAGGAGVTPFIAILRSLAAKGEVAGNWLIFSNKTERDIILREEFEAMDQLDCMFVVTDEPSSPLASEQIGKLFLKASVDDFDQQFYVCGPPKMVEAISEDLESLGASSDSVVFEE